MIEQSTLLSGWSGLSHGFSTRHYGPVRTGSLPLPEVVANRERLANDAGFNLMNGVMLNQSNTSEGQCSLLNQENHMEKRNRCSKDRTEYYYNLVHTA